MYLREFYIFTGGPKATCIGCAGFAAFSVAIEKFFDRHT
jgi:import inner membrane translocase subunit TIM22